jgi:putative hydrolase of the HAD superfamily
MSATQGVRNVIFDLGGVVFQWNVEDIVRRFYTDDALRNVAKQEIFKHPDWLEMDRGTLGEEEAIRRFQVRTQRPVAELQALMLAVRESLVPIEDTIELLHELAQSDVPLYCLSNMPAETFAHLRRRHSFLDVFRGTVISGEIRMIKPDPRIFEHIARRYRLTPAQTVFVDDNEPNTASADALGFKTVLFQGARQCREELRRLLRTG